MLIHQGLLYSFKKDQALWYQVDARSYFPAPRSSPVNPSTHPMEVECYLVAVIATGPFLIELSEAVKIL